MGSMTTVQIVLQTTVFMKPLETDLIHFTAYLILQTFLSKYDQTRHTARKTDRQTDRQRGRLTERQTDRQIERLSDRQTERQTDK